MKKKSDKINLLIVTFVPPYPANDGGKMSVYGTVNYLRNFFNITLVFKTKGDQQFNDVISLKSLWPDVNISNVHYESILHKFEINYFKCLIRFILAFIENRFLIKKVSKNYDKFSTYDYFPFMPNDLHFINHLEKLFENNFYEIIQIEHTPFLNLIHVLPMNSKKIFVQIENRYKILEDYFLINKVDSLFSRYIIENAKNAELNLLNKYDYILSLSENDKRELNYFLSEKEIFVSPFPVIDSLHSAFDTNNFKANKLVFLGSQEHSPNKDAIVWFVENIYPSVELKLYVTGIWENDFVMKYPNVIFTGFIKDLSEIMQNSIVISPIRLGGGGIRAKVIQAMAMKCPVISTELSCIGIESIEHKKNVFIANSITEFIDAINELHSDNVLCKFIISNAYEVVKDFYSERAVGEIRRKIYLDVSARS